MPPQQGFDDFRGLVTGGGDHHSHINRSGGKDWWHNNEIEMEEGYSTDLITQHSQEFIRQHKDEPFFLYVAHLAIHFPWQGPEDEGYRVEGQSYWNNKHGVPRGSNVGPVSRSMIEALDGSVGQILGTLKELDLDEDTFVIFTSDNGGYLTYSGGFHNISSNGPYRGQKTEIFEGGHRVPAIVRWPGKVKPGVTDQTTATFDLLPTFLELAGLDEQIEPLDLDGTSLTSLLMDGQPLDERRCSGESDITEPSGRAPGNWSPSATTSACTTSTKRWTSPMTLLPRTVGSSLSCRRSWLTGKRTLMAISRMLRRRRRVINSNTTWN